MAFRKAELFFTDPICLCLEQNVEWNVVQGRDGPNLTVKCKNCHVKVTVPQAQFVASIHFDNPYPGRRPASPSRRIEVVERRDGVMDFMAYLKQRGKSEPPS
jgi:hypothetical protein